MFLRPGEIIESLKNKKYILPGMKGADFGCGSGYFTALFGQIVGPEGKIYAIDIQEDALKEAQEFVDTFGLKNITFLKQDLESNTGLESNSLNFVFISQVLYQSERPERIVQEAYKVLKENGHLIILEPEPNNPLFLGQVSKDLGNILSLLEKENFKIKEIDQKSGYFLIVAEK